MTKQKQKHVLGISNLYLVLCNPRQKRLSHLDYGVWYTGSVVLNFSEYTWGEHSICGRNINDKKKLVTIRSHSWQIF